MLPLVVGSPGVYTRETDNSIIALGVPTSIGVLTFPSKKGTLTPQIITSLTTFTGKYGVSDVAWGYGHISAKAFLREGNFLWALRVPGIGAKFAGSSVTYQGSVPNGQYLNVAPYISGGTSSGYDVDAVEIHHTILSQNIVAGSSISGTISGSNVSVNITPIGYSATQSATISALVTSINSALQNFNSLLIAQNSAQAQLAAPIATVLNPDFGVIRIVSPEGVELNINFTVSNNGSPTQLEVLNSNLIDIFAENPGAWGNDIGYNITNIDAGIQQRVTLSFSSNFVSGNNLNIVLLLNNNPINIQYTVPNNEASDQSINNIAALIAQAFNTGDPTTATVNYPNGFGANFARVINIVAPTAGPGVIGVQSMTISGGSTTPVPYFNEILTGVASTQEFTLNIFQRGNLKSPIGSYRGTLAPQLNGFNDQTFLEEVINKSEDKSDSVRVVVNQAMVQAGMFIDPKLAASFNIITFLSGGNDGAIPTSAALITAWDTFLDVESYPANILINGGFTDSAVQQEIAYIADTRRDCIAIIDVPSDQQNVQDAWVWRTQKSNINTSFASIVSPDIQILDENNQRIFVPRSGYDAARYVYTDKNFTVWNAPAGYDRGRLVDALDFRVTYSKADRDILDAVQINCGKHAKDGSGLLIFGENTAQVTPSLLSSLAIRRNLNYIENTISNSVERNLFDLNSEQLAFLIRKRIEKFLQPIQDGNGLSNFKVVINASNNPAIFKDAGQLNISVYMTPVRPVRTILLDAEIVPNGITFDEFVTDASY